MRVELMIVEHVRHVCGTIVSSELLSTDASAADEKGASRISRQTAARNWLRNTLRCGGNLYPDVRLTDLLYWHGQAIVDDTTRAS
jgi:hypothetical protein